MFKWNLNLYPGLLKIHSAKIICTLWYKIMVLSYFSGRQLDMHQRHTDILKNVILPRWQRAERGLKSKDYTLTFFALAR